MYCAVHGPTPGRAVSRAIAAPGAPPGSSDSSPAAIARASAAMLRARAPTRPNAASSPASARATRSGVGDSRSSPACGVSTGSPNAAAYRPAIVVAAATVICWPRMARTASSNPSNPPGTRRPG